MSVTRQWITDAWTVGILILSTDAFLTLFVGSNIPEAARNGSPATRLLWSLIYLIATLRVIEHRYVICPLLRRNLALVCLVILTLASACWSIDYIATLHASIALLLATFVGIDFGLRYTLEKQIRLVAIALGIVLLISILMQLALPHLLPGRESEGLAWHGIFDTKNEFGRVVILGMAAFLCSQIRSRIGRLLILIAGFALVILARSAGALVYLTIVSSVPALTRILQWKPRTRYIGVAATATSVAVIIWCGLANVTVITHSMGRDPTLTGRVELWQMSLSSIREKPLFGYGYEAFWTERSPNASLIREAVNWDTPHSHDGYIDLMLGIGAIGLGLFVLSYWSALRRAWRVACAIPAPPGAWPGTFLVLILVYQITEGSVVTGNWILWILYVSISFALSSVEVNAATRAPIYFEDVYFPSRHRVLVSPALPALSSRYAMELPTHRSASGRYHDNSHCNT
jgi:O-antigen ligase